MSVSQSFKIKQAIITSNDGKRAVDIGNSIFTFDYGEDLTSPSVIVQCKVLNTSGIYGTLPIRCGEKLDLILDSLYGELNFTKDKALYVHSVSNIDGDEKTESFTLSLAFKEYLSNETTRVQKKYENTGTIDTHIKSILKDVLQTKRIGYIEPTANTYGFYGNLKKPFHTCVWLGPKSIPIKTGKTGTSGEGKDAQAKGTSGFFFYDTYDGYQFRSIEKLVSDENKTLNKKVQTFTATGIIESDGNLKNTAKIGQYFFSRNNDLMASLRLGLYANRTYFFDPYNQKLDVFNYTLKQELAQLETLSQRKNLGIPDFFQSTPSRILARSSDKGLFGESLKEGTGRENADMAKAFSRYNLLFTQTLNISIPLNVSLRAGDTVKIILPKQSNSNQTAPKVDDELSGLYVISAVRHHAEEANSSTSLSLVRDSYGLYKS